MVEQREPYIGDTTRSAIGPLLMASIISSYTGIGIMGAFLPREVPLEWPFGFLLASAAFSATAIFLLSRRRLAWHLFFAVVKWTMVVTSIFSATAIFLFILNDTPARTVWVSTGVLVLSALNLPILIAFSVARHERVED